MRAGLAVLDLDLRIQMRNELAADLWGLRPDEVRGARFDELDIGLPVAKLAAAIQECLAQRPPARVIREVLVDAINRRGRSVARRVV